MDGRDCASSKLRARTRDSALTVAALAATISDWLAHEWILPEVRVPDLREEVASDAAAAARILRDEWDVGHGPIPRLVALLETHGVRVFSLTDDVTDVDAFSFWHHGSPFVVLNQQKSGERGRFDGAHELGHLTLHQQIDFSRKDLEREADVFAAEFLVPGESLLSQLPSVITLDTVMELKEHWRVSAMAMVKRLKDVSALSEWVYRSMCVRLSSQGYRAGERGGIDREVSSIWPEILVELEREGGGIAQIADALNLRVSEVSPLIFGFAKGRGLRGLRVIRGGADSGT